MASIARPGMIVLQDMLSVLRRPLFITIATPAAFLVSGSGEWKRASLVSKDELTLSASLLVRWDSYIASSTILFELRTPYISNHFSWRYPLELLVLPLMLSVTTFRKSLVVGVLSLGGII